MLPSFKANFWVWSEKFIDHNKINEIKEAALKSINEDVLSIKLNEKQIYAMQNNIECTITVDQRENNAEYLIAQRFLKKINSYVLSQ